VYTVLKSCVSLLLARAVSFYAISCVAVLDILNSAFMRSELFRRLGLFANVVALGIRFFTTSTDRFSCICLRLSLVLQVGCVIEDESSDLSLAMREGYSLSSLHQTAIHRPRAEI
jgi:hypothetical protein